MSPVIRLVCTAILTRHRQEMETYFTESYGNVEESGSRHDNPAKQLFLVRSHLHYGKVNQIWVNFPDGGGGEGRFDPHV